MDIGANLLRNLAEYSADCGFAAAAAQVEHA
jgi:hypothetical protein